MDAERIWQELNLGDLLMQPRLLSGQSLQKAAKKDPFIKHDKKWRKPTYAVLKDRYNSLPTEPKFIEKKRIDQLADPIRGKYSRIDELLNDDGALMEKDVVSPSLMHQLPYHCGSSTHMGQKENIENFKTNAGFFLTETNDDNSDNEPVVVDNGTSFMKKRITEAAKYSKNMQTSVLQQKRTVKSTKVATKSTKAKATAGKSKIADFSGIKSSGYGPSNNRKATKATKVSKSKKSTNSNNRQSDSEIENLRNERRQKSLNRVKCIESKASTAMLNNRSVPIIIGDIHKTPFPLIRSNSADTCQRQRQRQPLASIVESNDIQESKSGNKNPLRLGLVGNNRNEQSLDNTNTRSRGIRSAPSASLNGIQNRISQSSSSREVGSKPIGNGNSNRSKVASKLSEKLSLQSGNIQVAMKGSDNGNNTSDINEINELEPTNSCDNTSMDDINNSQTKAQQMNSQNSAKVTTINNNNDHLNVKSSSTTTTSLSSALAIPMAPKRSTDELIASLKNIESRDIHRVDFRAECKLTNQLANYAKRIQSRLANAANIQNEYKELSIQDIKKDL